MPIKAGDQFILTNMESPHNVVMVESTSEGENVAFVARQYRGKTDTGEPTIGVERWAVHLTGDGEMPKMFRRAKPEELPGVQV